MLVPSMLCGVLITICNGPLYFKCFLFHLCLGYKLHIYWYTFEDPKRVLLFYISVTTAILLREY